MVFRGRQLSEITEQDLQRLVDDQVQERDTVEYKSIMYGNTDEDKRAMLKDITSIANHRGGYLIVGIEEDAEGIPTNLIGIDPGNHVERVTGSCLDNIEKRIVGLGVEDVQLANGKVAVIASVPESLNAPHMVTFKGLNQFWKRHGRQKDKMTIDEIGEAFERRLSNLNRLERFLFMRRAELLESIGDKPYMVVSSAPAYLHEQVVFDIHDKNLRDMIRNPDRCRGIMGDISCGQPYVTLTGLRADNRSPYWDDDQPEVGQHLELFRNGYIEYACPLGHRQDLYFASEADAALIVNFVLFVEKVYGTHLPLTPLVVSFVIYNAESMWLAVEGREHDKLVRWRLQHLELEKFYIENLVPEARLLPKAINDRIWQAFHRERASIFDEDGNLK